MACHCSLFADFKKIGIKTWKYPEKGEQIEENSCRKKTSHS